MNIYFSSFSKIEGGGGGTIPPRKIRGGDTKIRGGGDTKIRGGTPGSPPMVYDVYN